MDPSILNKIATPERWVNSQAEPESVDVTFTNRFGYADDSMHRVRWNAADWGDASLYLNRYEDIARQI